MLDLITIAYFRLQGVEIIYNEDEADAVLSEDDTSEIKVYLPDGDRACSSLRDTYKSSPFFQTFEESVSEVEISDGGEGSSANPFYVPKVVPYLLRHLLPYFPLWSRYLQSILLPDADNPLSNSPAELGFCQKKTETLNKKKNWKASRYLAKSLEDVEQRILVHPYPCSQFRSRKRKGASPEEEFPMKKPREEKWKKNKNLRKPGGLYSKREGASYGKGLVEKAKKLLLRSESKGKQVFLRATFQYQKLLALGTYKL